LVKSDLIFPGGQRLLHIGPLDKQLRNSTSTMMMNAALQDLFRYLEGVVKVWQGVGHSRYNSRYRLEERHMKDRMDRGTLRQLQLVGDCIDLLNDFIWSKKLEAELMMGARCQR
jgi:hypothetical protein